MSQHAAQMWWEACQFQTDSHGCERPRFFQFVGTETPIGSQILDNKIKYFLTNIDTINYSSNDIHTPGSHRLQKHRRSATY